MRAELQNAFVLHTRSFRDNGLLVDVLTQHHGRMTLVAKGVRRAHGQQRQFLQPFIPLTLSWQGRSQLKTLIDVEPAAPAYTLEHKYLYSGFYANELLMYVLVAEAAVEDIFDLYQALLQQLSNAEPLEATLRCFEFYLLEYLGYGIDFSCSSDRGEALKPEGSYRFVAEAGFVEHRKLDDARKSFLGKHVLAIAEGDFKEPAVLQAAKKIARLAFEPHLRGKVLKSRELFLPS